MSRSYKKTPIIKDNGRGGKGSHRKWAKTYSNRVVRRSKEDIPDGKYYRRLYNSWNIYDYITVNPWLTEINSQYNNNPYWCVGIYIQYVGCDDPRSSYDEIRMEWEKRYRRK